MTLLTDKNIHIRLFISILIAGTILSLWIFNIVQTDEKVRVQYDLQSMTDERSTAVALETGSIELLIKSVAGLYIASQHVDMSEFIAFINVIIPSRNEIKVVSWVPYTLSSRLDQLAQTAGEDGYKNYHIQEWDTERNIVSAGQRDSYYPVYHVYSNDTAWFPHGFDLGSLPAYQKILEQSRDSGQILSLQDIAVPAGDKVNAIEWFLPVYKKGESLTSAVQRRQYLRGYIVMQINVSEFIDAAFRRQFISPAGLDVYIVDNAGDRKGEILYFHPSRLRKTPAEQESLPLSGNLAIGNIAVANDLWLIMQKPLPGYFEADQFKPWVALCVGLLFTLLSAGYISNLQRQKYIVSQQVKKRTGELNQLLDEHDHAVQKLLKTEEKNRSILETVEDGIITIDSSGIVNSFNPAAEKIFGYLAKEVIGKNINMLMPEPYHSAHDTYLEHYLDTGEAKIIGSGREVTGLRKDNTTFPMLLAVGEMLVGNSRMFTGTITDITERKRAEKQLIHAKEFAEEANTAKSRFLANMSHELRTPLNAIIGYSEMLAEEVTSPKIIDDLKKIRSAGNNLLSMINDILDFSRIEAGKIELSPETFSIESLTQEIERMVVPLVEKNNSVLTVHYEPDLGDMQTDTTRLQQVLFNLLSNAAKFTKNGRIDLQVASSGEGTEKKIIFTVSDTGIGMDAEQINCLFRPFVQADDSTTRKYGGTGLGLVISQRFSKLLGGGITVKSTPGRGSVFTLYLPVSLPDMKSPIPVMKASSETEIEEPIIHSVKNPAGTILVIDDEATARELLCTYLNKAGWNVVTAADAKTGLRYAHKIHPDSITLDVLMPGLDGWAVLEILQADSELKSIPVIMCTIVDEKKHGISLGATDYLVKPIVRDQLIAVLNKYNHKKQCHLLIIEDDDATREIMARTAGTLGWSITEAVNGKQGLESIKKKRPDLILLDLIMPELDGFGVIEVMQREPAWKDIPVIIVTAKNLTAEDHRQLNSYVDKILEKGKYDINTLLEHLSTSLNDLHMG